MTDFKVGRMGKSRAKCHHKACKAGFKPDDIAIGQEIANHFDHDPDAKRTIWFHLGCYGKMIKAMRKGTKRIRNITDMAGFSRLADEDKQLVVKTLDI